MSKSSRDTRTRHFTLPDMGGDMVVSPLRRVWPVLASAVVVLAVFNSEGLVSWASKLPMNTVGEFIYSSAVGWHELMESIGATHLHDALRDGFLWFREW